MRETYVVLHLSPTGPKVITKDDCRDANTCACECANEGGSVLIMQVIAQVYGAPATATVTTATDPTGKGGSNGNGKGKA